MLLYPQREYAPVVMRLVTTAAGQVDSERGMPVRRGIDNREPDSLPGIFSMLVYWPTIKWC